jgi:16S rRNA (guanine527-N7)-methyltransferase
LERLEVYYRLLAHWNQKVNLTGLDMSAAGYDAIDRLLIEPLLAARYVWPDVRRAIDIGSGGGSPAIPLSLAVPELSMLLVEAKTRKSVFLREALRALGLSRCEVVTARFEELLTQPRLHEAHDLLTVRAVRVEPKTLTGLQAFVRPGGAVFLFRSGAAGQSPPAVTPPLSWTATHSLIESLGSQLVVLGKGDPGRAR